MEFVILFVGALVGFVSGWIARERYAMRVIKDMLEAVEIAQKTEEEERTKMRIERNGGFLYAFEDETDSFIAQGVNLEELDKAITLKFPGKKFSVREQNLIDIEADYHESV